jgi:hypothetical protein
VCWNKLGFGREATFEEKKEREELKEKYWIKKFGWDIKQGEIRCKGCGMPIADLKATPGWDERFAEECTRFCCACCPYAKISPCPKEDRSGSIVDALAEARRSIEAEQEKEYDPTVEIEKAIEARRDYQPTYLSMYT